MSTNSTFYVLKALIILYMIELQILCDDLIIRCTRDVSTTFIKLRESIKDQFKDLDCFSFQVIDIYENTIDVQDEGETLKTLRVRSGDTIKLQRKQSFKQTDQKILQSNPDVVMHIEHDAKKHDLNIIERQLKSEYKIQIICEQLKQKDKQIEELTHQVAQIPQLKSKIESIQSLMDSQHVWNPVFQEFQITKDTHFIQLQEIPKLAQIIKVHIQTQSGNNPGLDSNITWVFSTNKDQLWTNSHPYQQAAWNSSSDNCTFCLDETRRINIKRTADFPSGNFKFSFVILGYK